MSTANRKLMMKYTLGKKLVWLWVWEYVLKHTSDVNLIRKLAQSLPVPEDVWRLKQMILIKQLSFLVSRGLDIQKTLDTLEALYHAFEIECIDKAGMRSEDIPSFVRFKASHPDAPEVNIETRDSRDLQSSELSNNEEELFVWKGLQHPILELKEELRKLLRLSASEKLDASNAKVKIIENKLATLIRNFWAIYSPVFLEKIEEAANNGKYKLQGLSVKVPSASDENVTDTVAENSANSKNEGVPESNIRGLNNRCLEIPKDVNGRIKDLQKPRQTLDNNHIELQKFVKYPLPPLPHLKKPDSKTEAQENIPSEMSHNTSVKRSLLKPLPSTRVQGWDEALSSCSPSDSRQIRLPHILRPNHVTLPPRYSTTGDYSFATGSGLKRGRQKKNWSELEVEALKSGVRKYGEGHWKTILQKKKDVLYARTGVDLKDKWRNLVKSNFVHSCRDHTT